MTGAASARAAAVAVLLLAALLGLGVQNSAQAQALRFAFGDGPAAAGEVRVGPDTVYRPERGHGFEPQPGPAPTLAAAVAGPRAGHAVLAPQRPLHFSVTLPEGSWRVTATLGGTAEPSDTTLKAELRRLVLQAQRTPAGQAVQAQFTVHVRQPGFPGGQVALRHPREAVDEAWNWDGKLTLEINGPRPVLQALQIERVQVPLVFLLGDSTVADQVSEPYASWGQQLPRWFGAGAAVVNLAQSGETTRDSLQRRRLDKILALARPGDTVLMQYGHNDQKQLRDGSGSVQTYQDELRQHLRELQAAQLRPVVVGSVERRFFEPDGSLRPTLAEHVAAARAVAEEFNAPFLDLNAASRQLYRAYGPLAAQGLFATGADGRVDPTHHSNAGAWVLAALVAQGLRDAQLPAAAALRADAPRVNAAQPPALATLTLPPSPGQATRPPAGDGRAEPAVGPQDRAIDPARLARIDNAIRREIEAGRLAGAVVLLWRDGQPLHESALGLARIDARVPMRRDTLFRIASMSKAVTTVAAMMLYEEGHFLLRDPVSQWLPAFGRMGVAVPQPAGGLPPLEPAQRPVTVRDLLLHTAGLSYGAGPAAEAWRGAGLTDWPLMQRDETLAQWVDRLTALPLQGPPGQAFQYGYATDVLSRLVEIWSGQPLERFVAERITGPLNMPDTHFWVPPEKAARLADVYGLDNGRLRLRETAARSDFVNGSRRLASGGAGLVSTAPDYARFLQMLLNGGTLDGVRLLSPATVAMMTRDHLGPRFTGDAEGAGYGFWIAGQPGTRSELASPGAWGWGSAYSPQYVVDPATRTVFVYMAQLRPAGDSTLHQRVKVLARQALPE